MVETSRLRELLDEYRFDEAEQLAGDNTNLAGEVAARRSHAEKQAEVIMQRLIELGQKGQLDDFLEMADDPVTTRLVDLASSSSRDRVDLYIQEAERWRRHQMEANARRLGEARRALDGLDLGLAQGLMGKVDERYLSDEGREERDRLLLDMSARTMEVESLAQLGGTPKRPRKIRRGRSKKRRRR